jgi:hypothetical protein
MVTINAGTKWITSSACTGWASETNFRYIVIVALECKIIQQPSHLMSTPKTRKV